MFAWVSWELCEWGGGDLPIPLRKKINKNKLYKFLQYIKITVKLFFQ